MKVLTKKKIGGLVVIAFVAYMTFAIIPNMFVKKGIAQNKIEKFQIIAHRGGAGIGNENTLWTRLSDLL